MSEVALLESSFKDFVEGFLTKLKTENTDLPDYLINRHREMMFYNCIGGKYFRGVQVYTFAKQSIEANGGDFATIEKKALALAWAIEVLQACFLVADDLMDGSTTRRGQPCWYRQPHVQNDAVNDALVLESFMHFLIEIGTDDSNYIQISKLYLDTCVKTQLGQTLDLLSMPQGRKSLEILNSFDLALYKRIVKYKTAFYTFYAPMAAGLILGGVRDAATLNTVQQICIEIGEKFQIQDDYLDCYGEPALIGKIGTDIQDHKCSWLCVQALERMNPEQRARFEANYGHEEPEKVQVIKDIFNEINIPELYKEQEEASLARINALIKENADKIDSNWFTAIIKRVHNRQK